MPAAAQSYNTIVCSGATGASGCLVDVESSESLCNIDDIAVPSGQGGCDTYSAIASELTSNGCCDATWVCADLGGGAVCIGNLEACVPDDFNLGSDDCGGNCVPAVNCVP